MALEIAIIFALVLVNGLFAGAEIATVTLRKTRIEQLLLEGKRSARAVAELRGNPERFLATVQVGITVVGIAAAAYGGETLAVRLSKVLEGAPYVGAYAHSIAFAVVVTVLSYFSLVLGELVPKSLALRASEPYALLVGRPLLALANIARPVVWLLTQSSNAVLRIFGDRTSFTESRMSPDELKALLEEAGAAGEIDPSASEIATRALELADLTASEVMVPRKAIVAIEKGGTVAELRRLFAGRYHTRLPVYQGSIDSIVGIVSIHDAFERGGEGTIDHLIRPAMFVPEQTRAVDLLPRLQAAEEEIAIVVDEHGGTAGLVTRIDVAEELFGHASDAPPGGSGESIRRDADGSVTILGTAPLREVNRALDLRLPEDGDWSTMGGLCVGLAGRIPKKGEHIAVPNGPTLEIADASPRRVRAVRVRLPSDGAQGASGPPGLRPGASPQ